MELFLQIFSTTRSLVSKFVFSSHYARRELEKEGSGPWNKIKKRKEKVERDGVSAWRLGRDEEKKDLWTKNGLNSCQVGSWGWDAKREMSLSFPWDKGSRAVLWEGRWTGKHTKNFQNQSVFHLHPRSQVSSNGRFWPPHLEAKAAVWLAHSLPYGAWTLVLHRGCRSHQW
jgi:hypothetical protein